MDRPTGGTDAADLQRLAEDWIALWQSELSALAADRETAEAWRAWGAAAAAWMQGGAPGTAWPPAAMAGMAPGAAPGWPTQGWPMPAMPGLPPSGAMPQAPGWGIPPWPWTAPHDPAPAAPPGPPPAAAAPVAGHGSPDGRDGDAAALRAALERIERRLAALEVSAGGGDADRGRPRRRPAQS